MPFMEKEEIQNDFLHEVVVSSREYKMSDNWDGRYRSDCFN